MGSAAPASPRLSVIIPCFNVGADLVRAVDSVLASPGPAREILVIDDHSDAADTRAALQAVAARGARVSTNPGPRGVAAARNVALAQARAPWIAFLDADDLWLPDGLGARWHALQTHAEAGWLSSDFVEQHEDGRIEAPSFYRTHPLPYAHLRDAYESGRPMRLARPLSAFLEANLAWTGTVLVRTDLLRAVGGFDARLRKASDTDLWLRLAARTDLVFVPTVTAVYRQRAGSLVHEAERPYRWEMEIFSRLLSDAAMRQHRGRIRRRLVYCVRHNADFLRHRGEHRAAAAELLRGLRLQPAAPALWRSFAASLLGR